MTQLAPVLAPRDLPLAELHAARLDGELYAVAGCFSPVDTAETTVTRATAVRLTFGDRFIAEQRTAAWIWGVTDTPPAPHQLCTDARIRTRVPNPPNTAVREAVLDDSEVVVIAGARVTGLIRTVTDLARLSPDFASAEASIVRALMARGRFSLDECARALDSRRNLPLKKIAWRRLLRVHDLTTPQPDDRGLVTSDQPELTR